MVVILYEIQQHVNGSFAFAREISMSSLWSEKDDKIREKIEQDRHISSHDIAQELNIHQRTILNHLYIDTYVMNRK